MEPGDLLPEDQPAGGLTPDQIEALKKKHGKLTLLTIETEDGDKHFWFKKPDMATISAVTKTAQRDPIAASQIFFTNCLVHGDASAVNNVDEFWALSPYLEKLIEEKTVRVKNF